MQPVSLNSHGINSKSTIDRAIDKGLKGLFKPPPMTLHEWAEEHYYLSPESSSVAGAWETIPYQKGIMNCISNDDIRKVTWMKSARTGYTKVIVAAMGYFAEHKKRSQVIYQPTDDDRDAFVKDEIEPMLRDVPSVQQIFPWFDKKHKNNTLQKKTFLGSLLHMLGGKSPRNFRRITVDVVYYDELAGFDHDIGGEGSATSLGDTRLTTSSFPKSIRGSTPKTKDTCQIEQSLSEADVVLRFYLSCPHCSERDYLKWGGKGAGFGITWTDDNPKTAHYVCPHCRNAFGYEMLADLLEQGRWQSEDGIWLDEDDMFRSADGLVMDTPMHVGFHLWAAYSIFMSWTDLAAEYLEAVTASKRGELGKLKSFINTRLGEVWEDDQGERLEPEVLYNRREHYPSKDKKILIPNDVVYLTIGGDTQDDRFEWEVVGWGAGEESWSIDYQALYGNLSQPEIWKALGEMLQKPYLREDGTEMNVGLICWDSGGHFTDDVYALSKKLGVRWFIPTKGANQPGKPIADFPRKRSKKGVYLTMTGGDNAKELIYQRLNITPPKQGIATPGACHWPINDDTHGETYFQQLMAEKKTLQFVRGQRVYTYLCPKGKRNEVLDCRVGALAALRIAKQHFGIDLDRLSLQQKQARETGAPAQPKISMANLGSLLGS